LFLNVGFSEVFAFIKAQGLYLGLPPISENTSYLNIQCVCVTVSSVCVCDKYCILHNGNGGPFYSFFSYRWQPYLYFTLS